MAARTLVPGAMITESGLYLVSHSIGHMPDAECHLVEGLLLPSCPVQGCSVSYSLLRRVGHILEDEDFKPKSYE